MGFSKGLKNEFETAVVNEPSVFEPLKFYCNMKRAWSICLQDQKESGRWLFSSKNLYFAHRFGAPTVFWRLWNLQDLQ